MESRTTDKRTAVMTSNNPGKIAGDEESETNTGVKQERASGTGTRASGTGTRASGTGTS